MTKKGEKSLQMIFGLFLLLIISLVVLNLFFKFTEKSSSKMESASTEYFSKASKGRAIQDCQALCDNIKDIGTLMEFCRTHHSLDWNGNQIADDLISEGKWDFCENKIPCFVLIDNCGQTSQPASDPYDGYQCARVLNNPENNRLNWYTALACDDGVTEDFEGTCGLDVDSTANWMNKFGFACSGSAGAP